jgi:hypothetical protein
MSELDILSPPGAKLADNLKKITERPPVSVLDRYKDNPANRGLILKTDYVPFKPAGPTSLCVV